MISFVIGLCAGVPLGMLVLAWVQIEVLKTKDLMMIDGKAKWVNRLERFRQAERWLGKNKVEITSEQLKGERHEPRLNFLRLRRDLFRPGSIRCTDQCSETSVRLYVPDAIPDFLGGLRTA